MDIKKEAWAAERQAEDWVIVTFMFTMHALMIFERNVLGEKSSSTMLHSVVKWEYKKVFYASVFVWNLLK